MSWRSRIAGVGIVAVMAGVALCCSGGEGGSPLPAATPLPQDQGVEFGGGFLATSNRTSLSVCVDGTPGHALTQRDLDAVARALRESAERLDDYDGIVEEQVRNGRVVPGCPPPTIEVGKPLGSAALDRALHDQANRSHDAASPHLVFVYFVQQDSFGATFGGQSYMEGTAEMLCGGDVCAGVTTTLYVPDSITPDDLQLGMIDAIGLVSSAPVTGPQY